MNYQQQEQVKEFVNFLKVNHHKAEYHRDDFQAKDADLLWDASRFFANIMHRSSGSNIAFTHEKFNKFKSDFEQINSITINEAQLFERYWLRSVLGYVKIPGAISYSCLTFERILPFREELNFLNTFQSQLPTSTISKPITITKEELEVAIKAYENDKEISLNREGVYFKSWLSEKDGKISLSDINIYFKHFLDYWDDFVFINAVKKEIYKDEAFIIDAEEFDRILAAFKILYPSTPDPKDFTNQNLLIKRSKSYRINFLNTKPDYWFGLQDKIAGHYWELLIQESSHGNDEDRIKIFLNKVLFSGGWPDFLQFVTSGSKQRFLNAAFGLIITEPDIEGVASEYDKVRLDNGDRRDISIADNIIFTNRTIFSADNRNLYELLEGLYKWEGKAQITQLYGQEARRELSFLISTVVSGDDEFIREKIKEKEDEFQTLNYKHIIMLLRAAITKPFLLWGISENITRKRPEVIPYLLIESDLASIAFAMLDSITFSSEHKYQSSLVAWKKATALMLQSLPDPEQNARVIATIIFQVYRKLNQVKYDIPYYRNKNTEVQSRIEIQQKEREVLYLIENAPLHNHMVSGNIEEYLLPYIFTNLAKLFSDFKIKPTYRNGTIQFPMLQWDGIIWLLKISTYWKYKAQFKNLVPEVGTLTKTFLALYLKTIKN